MKRVLVFDKKKCTSGLVKVMVMPTEGEKGVREEITQYWVCEYLALLVSID